jgi:EAL domain-containing protein (putative c-di-GMP-specific phosphodiesterase class I)
VRSTGCDIVVEGIETEDQRLTCVDLKVDLLQGYHLGRPTSADLLRHAVRQAEAMA